MSIIAQKGQQKTILIEQPGLSAWELSWKTDEYIQIQYFSKDPNFTALPIKTGVTPGFVRCYSAESNIIYRINYENNDSSKT